MAKLTKQEILRIAQQKGWFRTTPRWRDDQINSWCNQLVREGLLKRAPDWHKFDNRLFLPAAEHVD